MILFIFSFSEILAFTVIPFEGDAVWIHKDGVWIKLCITVLLGNMLVNERGSREKICLCSPRSFAFRSRAKTSLFQTDEHII